MRITKNWKNILSIGLAVLVLFGAVGAVAAFATNDSKPVSSLGFVVGDIDPDTGEFVESDKSIYTDRKIICNGLKIVPSFEFKGTYDVFYYDVNENLITKKIGITGNYKSTIEIAQYCRIVIHPDVPEGVKEKDFEINFFEAKKIASMFKITVSKGLNKYGDYEDYFDGVDFYEGKIYENSDGVVTSIKLVDDIVYKSSTFVDLNGAEKVGYVLTYDYPPESVSFHIVFSDDNGKFIGQFGGGVTSDEGLSYCVIDVPEGATRVAVSCGKDVTVRLYEIVD